MYLVQILLPISANGARPQVESVLDKLTAEFGGVTAFVNSPAHGLWEKNGEREQDRIVTVEVMVDAFDAGRWRGYRKFLEATFKQDEVVIRVMEMTKV